MIKNDQYLIIKDNTIVNKCVWVRGFIETYLEKTFNIPIEYLNTYLSVEPPTAPIILTEYGIEIIKAEIDNTLVVDFHTEYISAYNFDFVSKKFIPTKQNKDLEEAKARIRDKLSDIRYKKEISGTTYTINNKTHIIPTDREFRSILFQASELNQTSTKWKLPSGWVELTPAQLLLLRVFIRNYVQGCFDWEYNKNIEVDSCTTVEQLKQVSLAYV